MWFLLLFQGINHIFCTKLQFSIHTITIYVECTHYPITPEKIRNKVQILWLICQISLWPEKDTDTIWFIQVTETNCISDKNEKDSYDHIIPPGSNFMKGHFLERLYETKSSTIYKLKAKKVTYFYKETVIFPYVNVKESKKGLEVDNKEFTDIICHAEQIGYAHL